MKKRIGRGLNRDKSPLLEGLFTRELTHTDSHTATWAHHQNSKYQKGLIKYTKLQNYGSYSPSVELINSCSASKTL